ncbi:DMT family transporter [Arcobacter sp. F2176]|uniref:DMT family transporter n=1 Tax=Arcobacter sp. F2176 TaxID=2044511 RepID=UPI00100A9B85|nr:DMT family transporter [Arcobacter sp. F2176]RXJ82397.1 EamA family transporter [Arcobacter sp. F2176]
MNKKLLELRADFLLLTVAIAWGVTFLMVQDAIKSVPVYAFLFWRFGIATILMAIIAYKYFDKLNKQTILYGVILGCFLFSAFATQTFGLAYTKSSIIAFLTGLNVIIVPFLAYVVFKEHVRKMVFISSLIAVCGLYLLTMSGSLSLGKGEVLGIICALLFALQILFTDKYSKRVNVYLLVLFQFITVTILSLLFSLSLDSVTFDLNFNNTFLKALIITSIFATVYAFLIQTYMQQFTTPTKTAVIFSMEPVSAGVYGYFVGNELLSSIQLFGATLIIFALLLAEIKFKKK